MSRESLGVTFNDSPLDPRIRTHILRLFPSKQNPNELSVSFPKIQQLCHGYGIKPCSLIQHAAPGIPFIILTKHPEPIMLFRGKDIEAAKFVLTHHFDVSLGHYVLTVAGVTPWRQIIAARYETNGEPTYTLTEINVGYIEGEGKRDGWSGCTTGIVTRHMIHVTNNPTRFPYSGPDIETLKLISPTLMPLPFTL